jgi:CheY-like chemotaxis protein
MIPARYKNPPQDMAPAGKENPESFTALSHQIRTIMNSVIGFSDLLDKTPLNVQQREYVDAIHESALKLAAIMNDLQNTKKESEHSAAANGGKPDSMRGISVLVVEDEPLNQKLMGILLRRMECTVDFARNGHEAILKAGAKNFDIILMDVQMPLMDGLEATEFLRGQMHNDTPIIALTAKVSKETDEKCIIAGMNDFLCKPVDIGLLKEKILKWAKHKPGF